MITDAVRVPSAVGVKVTFAVALPPGATVMGNAGELNENSAALLPPSVRLEITSGAVPGLLIVNGVAALVLFNCCAGNVTLLATEICGAVPVPVRATTFVVALLVMVSDADRAPAAEGVNVKLTTVVLLPGATVIGDAGVGKVKPAAKA